MLGETVAVRAARKIADRGQQAVVLPVLWTGLSEHHMSFGGTITLDFPAFSAVVEGVCRSVLRHGFKRIVLLNAHGGNENALRTITDDLTPKLGVADRAVHLLVRGRGGDRQDPGDAGRADARLRGGDLDDAGGAAGAGGDGPRGNGKGEQHARCRRRGRRRRVSLAHDRLRAPRPA